MSEDHTSLVTILEVSPVQLRPVIQALADAHKAAVTHEEFDRPRVLSREETLAKLKLTKGITVRATDTIEQFHAGSRPIDEPLDMSEVRAAMRAGVCDDVTLVGKTVLYETDQRGGAGYCLPAIVTCVQRTHPDLRYVRAAEEAFGRIPTEEDHAYMHNAATGQGNRVLLHETGIRVGLNPVPVPLDGTVHLHVLTPGPQQHYTEFSVPYHASRIPRSWRFHPDDLPF